MPATPDELWCFEPFGDHWIRVWTIAKASSHGKRFDSWPTWSGDADAGCAALAGYDLRPEPYRIEALMVPLSDGMPVIERNVVSSLGQHLLVHEAHGGFSLLDRTGVRAPIVPASCHGAPLHVDPERAEVLVGCRQNAGDACGELVLFSAAQPRAAPRRYGRSVRVEHAWLAVSRSRFYRLGSCSLLDLRTGLVHEGTAHDWIADSGPHVVLVKNGKLLLRNVDDATELVLGAAQAEYVAGPSTGNVHVIGGVVIDFARGRSLGTSPEEPLAVALDGRVLAWEPGLLGVLSANFELRYGRGPLRWYLPAP